MKRSDYLPYLRTMRRVPDEVILSIVTREMDMNSAACCFCGTAIRETLVNGATFEDTEQEVEAVRTFMLCQKAWGGTVGEWRDIYEGVTEHDPAKVPITCGDPDCDICGTCSRRRRAPTRFPAIETAFCVRLDEACKR